MYYDAGGSEKYMAAISAYDDVSSVMEKSVRSRVCYFVEPMYGQRFLNFFLMGQLRNTKTAVLVKDKKMLGRKLMFRKMK